MIDFHTHLDLYPNPMTTASQTNAKNHFSLAVTTSPRAWIATSKVFSRYNNIKVALGLHPEIAEQKASELELMLSSIPLSVFIGEIGIDGSPRFATTLQTQKRIFHEILYKCEYVGNKILSIHSRQSVKIVLDELEKFPNIGTPVLHWFSGTLTQLQRAIDLGCWFSVGPAMLRSLSGKKLILHMPLDRILPESDGPFATQNGFPIMPWNAIDVVHIISRITGYSSEGLFSILYNNCMALLNKYAITIGNK